MTGGGRESPAWHCRLGALLFAALLLAVPAQAETIAVGPNRVVKLPSDALKTADDGDIIAIDPGEYYDCLRVRTSGITVEGTGPGVVLTDTTCDGKAIIVAGADRLVLRNLVLQRARVADGNGAGIRAEGGSITIDKVQFLNNQAGLIAASLPDATILIRDSRFDGSGTCDGPRCAATISVNHLARLRIERSLITGTRGAHQIVSGAAATEIVGSRIEDGPKGSASFQLIMPDGGGLLLDGNTFQKGPHATNLRAAILLDGSFPTTPIIRRNTFLNDTTRPVPFILNWSDNGPVLDTNTITPPGRDIASDGYLTNRATTLLRDAKQAARGVVRGVLGR